MSELQYQTHRYIKYTLLSNCLEKSNLIKEDKFLNFYVLCACFVNIMKTQVLKQWNESKFYKT